MFYLLYHLFIILPSFLQFIPRLWIEIVIIPQITICRELLHDEFVGVDKLDVEGMEEFDHINHPSKATKAIAWITFHIWL